MAEKQIKSDLNVDGKLIATGETISKTVATSTGTATYGSQTTVTETNGHNSAALISAQAVANHSGTVKNLVVVGLDGRANLSSTGSASGLYATSGRATLTGSSTITGSASAFYGYTTNSSSSVVPWVIGAQFYIDLNGTNSTTYVRGVYTDINNLTASPITDTITLYNGHFNNTAGSTVAEAAGIYTKINNTNGTITNARGGKFDISTTGSGVTTTATGILVGEWETTGTVGTSYGIMLDSTIDAGTTKYAIYSLSLSPSILSGSLQATVLKSSVASGTAPIEVTSDTLVTNLNADKLDGQHGSYYATASALSDKEDTTNKVTTLETLSDTLYPTTDALFQARDITSADSVVQSDNGGVIYLDSSSPFNLTLNELTAKTQITLINIGSAEVTLVAGSGVTIIGDTTVSGDNTIATIIYKTSTSPLVISSSQGETGSAIGAGYVIGMSMFFN